MEQSSAKFDRIALESISCGVVLLDRDFKVLGLNSSGAGLLGCESAGRSRLMDHLVGGSELLADVSRRLKPDAGTRSDAAGVAGRVTLRGLRTLPEARGIVVDISIVELTHDGPARGANDQPVCYVATVTDAGARVSAEAEAARLREKLNDSEVIRARLTSVQSQLAQPDETPEMIGSSAGLARVRTAVLRVAPTDTTVLVQGETGSGKELVARLVHAESARVRGAFVAVNCAALPESLIESELFGHERGAFTGADRRKLGKFELADGGTIFLDEIAELPLAAQAKLLRVLQGGAFERVGGTETVRVDARVVAATHRELARRVERGLFREDLFYRLNVFRIDVPPLRERREDLRELVEHLHAKIAKRLAKPVLKMSDRSLRRVMAYRWPGNIRELANAVERATLLADGNELEIELPESASPAGAGGSHDRDHATTGAVGRGPAQLRDVLLDLSLEQLQRLHIMHTLESCDHRVFGPGGAAEKLDINPQTLLSRMDKYGIPRPRIARSAGRGRE